MGLWAAIRLDLHQHLLATFLLRAHICYVTFVIVICVLPALTDATNSIDFSRWSFRLRQTKLSTLGDVDLAKSDKQATSIFVLLVTVTHRDVSAAV